jgi:hypothetical protein
MNANNLTRDQQVAAANIVFDSSLEVATRLMQANVVDPHERAACLHAVSDVLMGVVSRFTTPNRALAMVDELKAAVVEGIVRGAPLEAGSGVVSEFAPEKGKISKTKSKSKLKTRRGKPRVSASKRPASGRTFKSAATAKLHDQLFGKAAVRKPSAPVPALVAALGVNNAQPRKAGRPRRDAPKPMVPKELRRLDAEFRAKHPPLEGLNARNTVASDKITVIMDGKKLKMIKRHLLTKYGITFEDYKRIYGLGDSYPSCAPGYSLERSEHAVKQGLGTERVAKVKIEAEAAAVPVRHNRRLRRAPAGADAAHPVALTVVEGSKDRAVAA